LPPPVGSIIASAESKLLIISSNAYSYSANLYATVIVSAKPRAFRIAFSRSSRPIFSLTGFGSLIGVSTTGGLDGIYVDIPNLYSGDDYTSIPLLESGILVNGVASSPYFEVTRPPSVTAGVIGPPI
jgi:hypothetical protein